MVVIVRSDSSSSRWLANAASMRIEGARQRGQQALPQRRQPGPPLFANEQGRAEPLLKALHLVGHRRLGHPELGRRGREIFGPRRRFECSDRRKWWKPSHRSDNKPAPSRRNMRGARLTRLATL